MPVAFGERIGCWSMKEKYRAKNFLSSKIKKPLPENQQPATAYLKRKIFNARLLSPTRGY
jgi:hypothetical protein